MLHKRKLQSPIGTLTLLASDTGLRSISFEKENEIKSDVPESKQHSILNRCEMELQEYFQGRRSTFTVPLEIDGTEFQKKVWSALTQVPYGKTESYLSQAKRVGNPKGVRAVAAANGKNPIPIIIPCHRVIATTGHLHGYGGGLTIKQQLLEIEGLTITNQRVAS